MSARSRLDPLVGRPWRACTKALPGAAQGAAEGVHKARVATRRLREALPVAAAGAAPRRVRRVRRKLRRLGRALGPVRELDVALTLAADLARERPSLAPALEPVRQRLEAARAERREQMLAVVDHFDRQRLAARLTRIAPAPQKPSAVPPDAARLLARVRRRVAHLRAAVAAAGALYAPEPLHAVRIAAKKLRYGLELARERRAIAGGRPIATLRAVQDLLGGMHDLQVLAGHVRAVQSARLDDPLAADLDAVIALIEERCRLRHADYVARRERLLRACDAVDALLARAAPRSAA